jgi:hypothetical protein
LSKRRLDPSAAIGDLFARPDELYPVRRQETGTRPLDLSLRIKTAMGQALKECPEPAEVVAARITAMTGREITADALYAYTAASKPDHDMGIVRFVAFVRATGAAWLFDELVRDDGLIVMEGREAHFARLGFMRQQEARLRADIRTLERDLQDRPVAPAAARRVRR